MEQRKESVGSALRRTIEAIAAEGRDVSRRVAVAVESAVKESAGAADALVDVARQTAAGAADGLERVRASERGKALSEVLDGLGEGLSRAGQGAKLAVEEAASRGKAFAQEDLSRLGSQFDGLRRGLADAIVASFDRGSRELRESLGDLRMHASRTADAARPGIEDALAALRRDPAGTARGAAAAGAQAGREALGALFGALGRCLERTGDRLHPRDGTPRDPTSPPRQG